MFFTGLGTGNTPITKQIQNTTLANGLIYALRLFLNPMFYCIMKKSVYVIYQ
jgi:hypothetical protein